MTRYPLLCVCVVFAFCLFAASADQHKGSGKMRMYPSHTVEFQVSNMINASNRHDVKALMTYISKNTLITYHSELPSGGIYKGYKGAFIMMDRALNTFKHSNCSSRIMFVDEAKGICGVESVCSGEFVRSKNKLDNVKSYAIVHMEGGKISKMNIFEDNYDKVLDAYRTKAEKAWYKFEESWALMGVESPVTLGHVSDNAQFELVNLYPSELKKDQGQLKGHQAFKRFAKELEFVVNNTQSSKILYADDKLVVSESLLGKAHTGRILASQFARPGYIGDAGIEMTSAYIKTDFDESGKITRSKVWLNRALTPTDLAKLKKSYKESES